MIVKGSSFSEEDLADTPGSVRPAKEFEYQPYYRLACAVIRGAVADYLGMKVISRYGTNKGCINQLRMIRDEAEGFLYGEDAFWVRQRSHWFGILGLHGDTRTVGKLVKHYALHPDELGEDL